LLLLDIDETELHDLSLRLHNYQQEFSKDIFPICCDIKNCAKVDRVFENFRPEIVFHAAAYKHVPMMEYYPEEAIRTNIAGSYNVLSSAVKYQAKKVIVISTDKAVNPTNVMGATKRVVEQEASLLTRPETEIVCVRFGNVLGSRGSMLPLFLEQIREGLPLTVTHKDIIRYFMTIPEAVSLVFLAGAMAKGGEVMVLDMGEPVKIYDFAQRLITYFGDGRSKVVVTGLRPGEKLYEELLANKDTTMPTDNKKVFKAKVTGTLSENWLKETLKTIHTDSTDELLRKLQEVVPEFHYQGPAPLSDLVKEAQ
jgi:FlaA1/EpsC-like NDP-sugar epimerase